MRFGTSIDETTTFGLDPVTNNVVGRTDALGRTTATTFDDAGNTRAITYLSGTNDGGTVSYAYTLQNQVAAVTNELGNTTTYLYDAGPYAPSSIVDALGHATSFAYDLQGRLVSTTDALGHTTTRTYVGPDLASMTDPLGNMTTYQHDDVGRLLSTSTALGAKTTYGYDGDDRTTAVIDPLSHDAGYTYDGDGNLKTSTDPNGNVTQYFYDAMNRQVKRTDPLLNSETTTYTDAGFPSVVTDRKGQQRIYTYDARNRLSEVAFHLADGGVESTIQYTYDLADRLTQVVDSLAGTITRSYDGRDDLLVETTPLGSVTYTYDLHRRRLSMTVSGQPSVTYGYDAADRLTSITRGTDIITLGYDNANRRTSLALPDGIAVAYGYDNANRLTSVVYTDGMSTLGNLSYLYDPAGHLISKGGTLAQVSLPAAVASATYNANNQLTLWGSQGFTYDLNGNTTSDGTMSYQWNTRNQLIALDGGAIASFQYDAFGRRTYKNVGGADTEYAYDQTGNIVAEYDNDGGQAKAFDLSTFGADELVCTYEDAGTVRRTLLPIVDPSNMSVIGLLSDGGIDQASYACEPYGQTGYVGDAGTDQQYTGRENDGTGLQYNRWRYYLPAQGRFSSEDPSGISGGVNQYAYARENPVQFSDPVGLWTGGLGFGLGGQWGLGGGAGGYASYSSQSGFGAGGTTYFGAGPGFGGGLGPSLSYSPGDSDGPGWGQQFGLGPVCVGASYPSNGGPPTYNFSFGWGMWFGYFIYLYR